MGEIFYRGYASTGSMSGAYPPDQASNLVAKPGKNCVYLTWTDPEDKTLADGIVVRWYYTKIVRRMDRYPNDENDGVTVVLNSVRNQYQTDPYIDVNLESDATYYYAAFACSTDEEEWISTQGVNVSVTTPTYRTMTVTINLNNSNPDTCSAYDGDAADAPYGMGIDATAFWQEFFGYRPCLFKDGSVIGYLNPNNYAQFEDGSTADITSGNSGEVMIEYPRRGIKISKSNKVITVSVTDDPDADGYTYYAHTRGTTRKDMFYLGAYIGYISSSKLHSLSGKTPTASNSLSTYRSYSNNIGSGFGILAFYQYLYIQVMYCLQFKGKLNSQNVVGKGNTQLAQYTSTGSKNTNGLVYYDDGGMKLFGLENVWGSLYQMVDGIYIHNETIYTGTDGFGNTSSYTLRGSTSLPNGYITDVIGTSELGFFPISGDGSSSTYFCDYGYITDSDETYFVWGDEYDSYYGPKLGMFAVQADSWNTSGDFVGTRLMYL